MFKFSEMQRNVAILTIGFLLLCLSCNYTFPLHRDLKKYIHGPHYMNHTQQCYHTEDLQDKMGFTTMGINNDHVGPRSVNNSLSEDDFRHYEQKVIMKKYPYLDFKEYELKLSPPLKLVRQNLQVEETPIIDQLQPDIIELAEDGPYVEITNRGLSGFAIPAISKVIVMKDNKDSSSNIVDISKTSDQRLGSLREDVVKFYKQINNVGK